MLTWTHPDGLATAYDDHGTGPPLVLLHAFPMDREMWHPQVTALSDRYRVIAPDLPGFGESGLPDDGWTVDSAADRLAAFIDGIGLDELAVVCGLSMGGYVALAFARRHPDKLRGLILADTRAEADTPEAKANRDKTIAVAEEHGAAAVFEAMLPKVLGHTTHQTRHTVVAEATRIAGEQGADVVADALRALRDRPDATPGLAAIRVPTLIIVGEEDTLTPPTTAMELADGIPEASIEVLAAAGHLSNLETPTEFTDVVRRFLDRIT